MGIRNFFRKKSAAPVAPPQRLRQQQPVSPSPRPRTYSSPSNYGSQGYGTPYLTDDNSYSPYTDFVAPVADSTSDPVTISGASSYGDSNQCNPVPSYDVSPSQQCAAPDPTPTSSYDPPAYDPPAYDPPSYDSGSSSSYDSGSSSYDSGSSSSGYDSGY